MEPFDDLMNSASIELRAEREDKTKQLEVERALTEAEDASQSRISELKSTVFHEARLIATALSTREDIVSYRAKRWTPHTESGLRKYFPGGNMNPGQQNPPTQRQVKRLERRAEAARQADSFQAWDLEVRWTYDHGSGEDAYTEREHYFLTPSGAVCFTDYFSNRKYIESGKIVYLKEPSYKHDTENKLTVIRHGLARLAVTASLPGLA